MCEKPSPPDNVDITEGQEPKDDETKLTEDLLNTLMPGKNSNDSKPKPPKNKTISKSA